MERREIDIQEVGSVVLGAFVIGGKGGGVRFWLVWLGGRRSKIF